MQEKLENCFLRTLLAIYGSHSESIFGKEIYLLTVLLSIPLYKLQMINHHKKIKLTSLSSSKIGLAKHRTKQSVEINQNFAQRLFEPNIGFIVYTMD